MTPPLTHASSLIYLVLAALLFATVFAIKADVFQYPVTAKQWKLEQTTLIVIAFLVVSLPFARRIKVSLIDAGVLSFPLWRVLDKTGNRDVSPERISVMELTQHEGKRTINQCGKRMVTGMCLWMLLP